MTPDSPALRITVLAGGPSAEREVSLASGSAVAAALRERGHRVTLADIGPDDLSALDTPADLIFPVLHGTFGEDGQLQAIMEQRGLRFVGSGSQASALAMDKIATKAVARELGIKVPEQLLVESPAPTAELAGFGVPVVVKPIDQGSSVATYIVHEPDGVLPAVADVVNRFRRAMVERFIAGDEMTVGIVGSLALPPICVRPKRPFYDYEAKYIDDGTEYLFEAGQTAGQLEFLQKLSLRVYEALGCRHLARIDWIADQHGRPWLLEANTIPGFTSHSLVPKAAARAGMSFPDLCDRLVRLALEDAA